MRVQVFDRPAPDGQPYFVQFRRVTPGYFTAMNIPIVRGRAFDSSDTATTQPVVLVSEGFADRFWPNEDPVGRRVKRGVTAVDWSVVVGVAGDVRDTGLATNPPATIYLPYAQNSSAVTPVGLVVKTRAAPAAAIPAIKQAIWSVDARQPLTNVVTLNQFLADSLGPQRFRAVRRHRRGRAAGQRWLGGVPGGATGGVGAADRCASRRMTIEPSVPIADAVI